MRTAKVVKHFQAIREAERQAISDSQEELVEKAREVKFFRVAHAVRKVSEGRQLGIPRITPRLSHVVLLRTLEDARSVKRQEGKISPEALSFIGDVIAPLTGAAAPIDPIRGKLRTKIRGSCNDAERFFAKALIAANTGKRHGQSRVSVYHDEEGLPLAFRKTRDESTALTLRPVAIKGIEVLPAGMIVALGDKMNNHRTGKASKGNFSRETYLVPSEGGLSMSPARLSSWAYEDPLDRSLYAVYGFYDPEGLRYDRSRGKIVEGYALDDFREAAGKVMEVCGVAGS